MKKILLSPVFWLIIVSLLPLWSLFLPGLPQTHDGQDHVARIANFYQSLSEGNIIPRWAGNLNWGYGHPILMFLYPLPSYIASFFHFLGFSLVDSTKLVFALSYIASILVMYIFMNAQIGSAAGFVTALLYGFAPYRFVDLYVRGAIGEHLAFVFPPLICYLLLRLSQPIKILYRDMYLKIAGLALSIAGLVLSHNAVTVMFAPVIFLYAVFLLLQKNTARIKFALLALSALAAGILISSAFLLPAFFEGKYTLRDIVTKGEFGIRFVPWRMFLYSPWNYGQGNELSKHLGFMQILGIFPAIYLIFRKKTNSGIRKMLAGLLVIFAVSIMLMTGVSGSIWQKITLLQKFQFPWRFLHLTTFILAVTGGIVINYLINLIKEKYFRKSGLNTTIMLYLFTAALIILPTMMMWQPKSYLSHPESFYTGVYESTTDTGESSPIWSVRFMEHRPPEALSISAGRATIVPLKSTTTLREYQIIASDSVRLVENTLYFPGWKIFVDGEPADIQYQDPQFRGLMVFRASGGSHLVEVKFGETRLRLYADYLSWAGFAIILTGAVPLIIWKKRK